MDEFSERIWYACMQGDLTKVKQLININENQCFNGRGYFLERRPLYTLHISAAFGHLDVVQFLLKNGEDINDRCTVPIKGKVKSVCFKIIVYSFTP